jgi:urease accessory protein
VPNLGIARLRTEQHGGQTVVVDQYSQAPLQLHKPLLLDKAAPPVVYLKTPSSGLLEGDEHRLEIDVSQNSSIEMRTQACTLVYPGPSCQLIRINVAEGGRLLFHPHSIILARDSELTQSVEINLARGGSLDYQEQWCAGRIAMGELWHFRSFDYRLEISVDGALTYRERWRLEPSSQSLANPVICGGFTHFRTRFMFNPDNTACLAEEAQPSRRSKSWSVQRDHGQILRTVSC